MFSSGLAHIILRCASYDIAKETVENNFVVALRRYEPSDLERIGWTNCYSASYSANYSILLQCITAHDLTRNQCRGVVTCDIVV